MSLAENKLPHLAHPLSELRGRVAQDACDLSAGTHLSDHEFHNRWRESPLHVPNEVLSLDEGFQLALNHNSIIAKRGLQAPCRSFNRFNASGFVRRAGRGFYFSASPEISRKRRNHPVYPVRQRDAPGGSPYFLPCGV